MTDSLLVLGLIALGLIVTGAGLCVFAAHIPPLARLTGAADLDKE